VNYEASKDEGEENGFAYSFVKSVCDQENSERKKGKLGMKGEVYVWMGRDVKQGGDQWSEGERRGEGEGRGERGE